MIVFNTFFKVAKKHLTSMIIYTVIFLGIVLMVVSQNKTNSISSFESQKLDVAVINHEDTDLANGLYDYVSSLHHIKSLEDDIDAIRDALYNRDVEYVLIIPEGFTNSFFKGNTDVTLHTYKLPGSISAQFLDSNINRFLSVYHVYLQHETNQSVAYEQALATLTTKADVIVGEKEVTDTLPNHYYFYLYLSYIFMCVILDGISPILMSFNEVEMKKRTLCGKMSATKRTLFLTLSAGIFAAVIAGFYILISLALFHAEFTTATAAIYIANAFLYAFLCLTLAFLVSSVTKKPNIIGMFSNVIGLGSSFLCGVFVPRELLSTTVSNIGHFLPAYWYVNVLNELTTSHVGNVNTIVTGFGVQALFAITFLFAAMLVSQKRK